MNECIVQTKQTETQPVRWNLRQERRAVTVSVIYQGYVNETFTISFPANLPLVLSNFEKLPCKYDVKYKFIGVKETALPFGLFKTQHSAALPNREAALQYLKGNIELPAA
jgi:hypothetical protein